MNNQKGLTEDIFSNPVFREQLKAIVLERVNVMPKTLRIAVGSEEFNKNETNQSPKGATENLPPFQGFGCA